MLQLGPGQPDRLTSSGAPIWLSHPAARKFHATCHDREPGGFHQAPQYPAITFDVTVARHRGPSRPRARSRSRRGHGNRAGNAFARWPFSPIGWPWAATRSRRSMEAIRTTRATRRVRSPSRHPLATSTAVSLRRCSITYRPAETLTATVRRPARPRGQRPVAVTGQHAGNLGRRPRRPPRSTR